MIIGCRGLYVSLILILLLIIHVTAHVQFIRIASQSYSVPPVHYFL